MDTQPKEFAGHDAQTRIDSITSLVLALMIASVVCGAFIVDASGI